MKRKWIQKAIKHPGALTKKAKAAGESPMQYAEQHQNDPGTTGKQARLAITLNKMHGRSTKGSPAFSEKELAQGHRKMAPAPASAPTPTAHERLKHLF